VAVPLFRRRHNDAAVIQLEKHAVACRLSAPSVRSGANKIDSDLRNRTTERKLNALRFRGRMVTGMFEETLILVVVAMTSTCEGHRLCTRP
jgi:hypothetical protein